MVKQTPDSPIKEWLSALPYLLVSDALKIDDYLQLVFVDGAVLSVYNPCRFEGLIFSDLIGCALKEIRADEEADVIVLTLDRGTLHVNVHPGAWTGPEAMVLHGPENLIMIW
ncbi:hypothetical protein D3C76_876560 [compost metagenome]|uniref:hypothetical protein n=1 Tax=Pseudomonas putida TaxID=303 RepID=UPI000C9A496F|nr:hypothetical protein [Pseudomonas putida]PNG88083.1 hypothetical protein CBL13_01952 [Pseudomonas putida]WPE26514.1 hypothetical protein PshuTeo1_22350 [Pseudomonas hunanensis]